MTEEVKKRVLVVEDEDDIRLYLVTLLSDLGFEVQAARDGSEALALMKAAPPNLITLDIVMPQNTGVKFYRQIKSDPALREIPVIIITGLQKDFEKFIHQSKTAPPPEGYLSKPFSQQTLSAEIEKLLGTTPETT